MSLKGRTWKTEGDWKEGLHQLEGLELAGVKNPVQHLQR